MLIPITSPDSDTPEWALVELQGRIEPLHEVDLQQSLHIGTLQLSKTNKDIVQLQIGYHILEGKRMPLRKPLAILETLQTSSNSPSSNSPSSGGEGGQNSSSSGDHNVSCKVVGVLRHKYLFKTRPKALISKPTGR